MYRVDHGLKHRQAVGRRANASADHHTVVSLRKDYLEMQRRWLALAHSYEFAEQLEFLSAVEARNKEARRIFEDAAA
jgi:hypothetical protein